MKRILMLTLMLFSVSALSAGDVIDLRQQEGLLQQSNGLMADTELGDALGLPQHESLKVVRKHVDEIGQVHTRYEQHYRGVPIWGHQVVHSTTQTGIALGLRGDLVVGIDSKLDVEPTLNSNDALIMSQNRLIGKSEGVQEWFFENESSRLVIFLTAKEEKLAYVVSFFADGVDGGEATRPTILVDAHNGRELFSYEGLTSGNGTGPGGNGKTGQYHYGTNYPSFPVTHSGSNCILETSEVKAVNMGHGTGSTTTAYSYLCHENTFQQINGAFSPINDAYNFGLTVDEMFTAWYLSSVLNSQMVLRVHYSNNYENAFWNGSTLNFGDGQNTFYPLVSLDVVAHEAAHGFTEQNSGLVYSGQSGGINEAFSDMTGEAAEYYLNGGNDYLVGADIYKSAGALRYMANPNQDGSSADHVNDYYSGMNVHYSSGIFNKAFYHLTRRPGWTTREAFYCFLKANRDYWTSSSTFVAAANDVYDAAGDLGYNQADVAAAFEQVGISLGTQTPTISVSIGGASTGTSGSFTFYANVSGAVGSVSYVWKRNGLTIGTASNVTTFLSSGTHTISVTATDSLGSANASKSVYVFACLIPSCECAILCP